MYCPVPRSNVFSFTEWIKGLLAVPFVLYSQPTGIVGAEEAIAKMAEEAHRRYAEIMRDVEYMIDDHSKRSPGTSMVHHQGLTSFSFTSKQ